MDTMIDDQMDGGKKKKMVSIIETLNISLHVHLLQNSRQLYWCQLQLLFQMVILNDEYPYVFVAVDGVVVLDVLDVDGDGDCCDGVIAGVDQGDDEVVIQVTVELHL